MTLNLNDPEDLTLERVREFIASVDDSVNRQLRVTTGGIAFMSDTIGGRNLEGIAFRIETWGEGNGWVGTIAADNDSWVQRIFAVLRANWPNPTDNYIDTY